MLHDMGHEVWQDRRRELLREAAEHALARRARGGRAPGGRSLLCRLSRTRGRLVARHEGGLG
ncbi:hypothetical protein [Rubrobacter xylanophilus]|uniref:hypothetical protein n=1 Tax=Rubrobacter xylanophilus TaxID=49319 RepID=UPI00059EC54C|nr:hypothetical protein [Rubrobacter xylanophilus]